MVKNYRQPFATDSKDYIPDRGITGRFRSRILSAPPIVRLMRLSLSGNYVIAVRFHVQTARDRDTPVLKSEISVLISIAFYITSDVFMHIFFC